MRFLVHEAGGLGNQMFQYAAGLYYARQYAAEVEILRQAGQVAVDRSQSRPFMLRNFQIKAAARDASRADERISDERRRYRPLVLPWRLATRTFVMQEPFAGRHIFKPSLPVPWYTRRVHLGGFWQVHQPADALGGELRSEYTLREPPVGENARVLDLIRQCAQPVSVHLRLGDYRSFLGEDVTLPLAYYANAMQHVRVRVPDPTFVVFSDEPEFARQHLPETGKAIFVHHNNALTAFEDLRLMAACKHHVIANSSFSWWGAWLNPDEGKLVCAPPVWPGASVPQPDILPPRWVKIDFTR